MPIAWNTAKAAYASSAAYTSWRGLSFGCDQFEVVADLDFRSLRPKIMATAAFAPTDCR